MENDWISVEIMMPSRGDYLCYVEYFSAEDATYTLDFQIELSFDPQRGWSFPPKTNGFVKYWKKSSKDPTGKE